MTRTGRVLQALAPLGGGALVALSLPPFGLWPLVLAGAALLPWAVNGRSPGGRAGSGFLAGVGQLVIGLAWADKFTKRLGNGLRPTDIDAAACVASLSMSA